MSKSFFTSQKDSVLAAASSNFSALLTAHFAEYHISSAQAAAYAALDATFQAAYLAWSSPYTRTKGTLEAKRSARIPLCQMASDIAKLLDGTPSVTNEQKADLGISVRATPGPVPPPGTPNDFKVSLGADGSLTLGWKINNPPGATGTVYNLWRRIGDAGEYIFLASTGVKRYADGTIPVGSGSVSYKIQAVRSTLAGPWAVYTLSFGTDASGTVTASVREAAAGRKAA